LDGLNETPNLRQLNPIVENMRCFNCENLMTHYIKSADTKRLRRLLKTKKELQIYYCKFSRTPHKVYIDKKYLKKLRVSHCPYYINYQERLE